MKVACIIENLASGGAQRQLCFLAISFKKLGIDVSVFTYYPQDFFLPVLIENGIHYEYIEEPIPLRRIKAFRKILRQGNYDVVVSFLRTPNLLAELAAIPWRQWGLIVSERTGYPPHLIKAKMELYWRSLFHVLADYVVTNSHTNHQLLGQQAFWLKRKIVTIYNCVDLQVFSPSDDMPSPVDDTINLLVVSRISEEKNMHGLIQAVSIVRSWQPDLKITVDWYGDNRKKAQNHNDTLYNIVRKEIVSQELTELFRFHPPTVQIYDVYRRASALIHPSFYEGLPNVVCEAMACGKPILLSHVCDSGNLVHDGKNGFLFNPSSPEDIARAIIKFAELSSEERINMGKTSRTMAERLFAPQQFIEQYVEVLDAAAKRRKIQITHRPPDVADSARQSLKL